MPSILGSGFYEIPPGQIGSGELVGNITMVTGLLQSYNYVSGSAGWIVNYDGSAEFSDITLYGGTIKYGKQVLQIAFIQDIGSVVLAFISVELQTLQSLNLQFQMDLLAL